MAYDWVLRGALLPGLRVFCYADDTLVVASGASFGEVARLATVGTSLVVRRIRALGLRVSLDKTDALLFHGPRNGPPPGAVLMVEGVRVPVAAKMKYLGLILDGRWNFEAHFEALGGKLVGAAGALAKLLPNIGGPKQSVRRLYCGIIRSMALYGAPIWDDRLGSRNRTLLRRPQRVMAVRVARCYRTVSFEAACLLAATPPWELEAAALGSLYRLKCETRAVGRWAELVGPARRQAREVILDRWAHDLAMPRAGLRTVEAIRPCLREWVNRPSGAVSFRMAQILSGHGCFGRFLHRVAGREIYPICHHCGAPEDTAEHTLAECATWSRQRHDLVSVIGTDLSLPSVVAAMLGSQEAWRAVAFFCERVLLQKEAAERQREVRGDIGRRGCARRRRGGGAGARRGSRLPNSVPLRRR